MCVGVPGGSHLPRYAKHSLVWHIANDGWLSHTLSRLRIRIVFLSAKMVFSKNKNVAVRIMD